MLDEQHLEAGADSGCVASELEDLGSVFFCCVAQVGDLKVLQLRALDCELA